jgi:hypothetical protein
METASGRAGFEILFDARGQQITYTDAGDARETDRSQMRRGLTGLDCGLA